MKNGKIEISGAVATEMFQCAIRYALPRHTYVVSEAEDWFREMAQHIPDRNLALVLRDIERELGHDDQIRSEGRVHLHDCDRVTWEEMAEQIRARLDITSAQQITAPDRLQPSSAQQGEDDVRIGGPAWVCHYCFKRNTHEMSRCVKCHKERNYLTR